MKAARFVVHKHQARNLHYDFRLEMEGVLKSWAVPKGPSMSPADKRLAVMVEDHPLDYRDFEGVIDEGEYGAGAVMIWDEGAVTWKEGEDPAQMLDRGQIEFELSGKKLKGRFALIRTRMGGSEKNWLLIKGRDEHARARGDVLKEEPDSVRTGRSLERIARDEGPKLKGMR